MPFILSIIEFYTAFSLQIKVRTFGHKPPEPTEDRSSFPARAVPLAIPLKLLRLTPRSCPKRCPKRCGAQKGPKGATSKIRQLQDRSHAKDRAAVQILCAEAKACRYMAYGYDDLFGAKSFDTAVNRRWSGQLAEVAHSQQLSPSHLPWQDL